MKLSTLYFNYVTEILLIIVTYFFSIQNENYISLSIISVFTFLLFLNFIVMCADKVKCRCKDCKCDFSNSGDGLIALIIFFVVIIIFYLLIKLFQYLSKKGKIIFFHIFSGLISAAILIIILMKYEKNDYDKMLIIFNIIYLSFLIITSIIMLIINNYLENLNKNNKILNDSTNNSIVNDSTLIENKDNQTNNKDFNNNSDNNTNYTNNNENNSNYNETKNNNNNEYNINYNETNNNSFNYNINNAIIADIQNLNSNNDLPTQEEIDNQTKK